MKKLTYYEMKDTMQRAFTEGKKKTAVIVFTEDSFPKQYSLESRSYRVSADNKVFNPRAAGYSLYGECLDGKDRGVRLEQYIDCEYGKDNKFGKDGMGWHVDYCYIEVDDLVEEMYDLCVRIINEAPDTRELKPVVRCCHDTVDILIEYLGILPC